MSQTVSLASPNDTDVVSKSGKFQQVWSDHIDQVTRLASGAVSAQAPKMQAPAALDGLNGAARVLQFTTAGVLRWDIGVDGVAEPPGTNNGSSFILRRYDAAGVLLGVTMTVARANGSVSFNGPFGLWGQVGPGTQPRRCVTLGDVINTLASYGMTA